jgi:hypothetical protein
MSLANNTTANIPGFLTGHNGSSANHFKYGGVFTFTLDRRSQLVISTRAIEHPSID